MRFIGIDTPESVAQDRPVECFGPEAKERTAELLPGGHAGAARARRRGARPLRPAARLRDPRRGRRVRQPAAGGGGLRRVDRLPAQHHPPGRARPGRGRRPRRRGGACGRPAGAPTCRSRPGSVGRRDVTRRAPGLRARRSPADHQLRRPRLVPRRQRRHLRGAARRHRHQRHADGPVPVGPRRRLPLPRRGRRRAPHPQRRARPLPLGADHPRARRCSTATAASPAPSPTCGTTPTSTRCAGSSGPRWSGRSCGAST